MSDQDRRKLLKSVSVASGALLVGKLIPSGWGKPTVNSVLSPAHASTLNASDNSLEEIRIQCEIRDSDSNQVIPEDEAIGDGRPLTATFTVLPQPQGTVSGTLRHGCDGMYEFVEKIQTNTNGVYSISFVAGSSCGNNGKESISITINGMTTTCRWNVFYV